ncbi:Protein of unknown function [Marinospirillum celere]|uniref:DUF3080 domain-containing protein n=1 Tax=Marinospirillum celere TaxID=1122252 RepID=A0A1I1ENC8_9GAMM|nr:DUF3080 family protein [Marinospirillum celere]SFB88166.1 Protein of unknown function [Marinospirillum celere]
MSRAWLLVVLISSSVLLLAGCSGSSTQQLLDDYLTRVTRALEIDAIQPEARPTLPNWPSASQREVPLQGIRLGLLEAYGLRACPDLLTRVAERNNQLGRVMIPSQRFLYELRLASTLQSCVENPSTQVEAETLEELERLTQQVYRRLPAVFWNFLVSSDEMAGLFSLSGEGLSPDRHLPLSEQQTQLEYLLETARLLENQQRPSRYQDFERELRVFRDQAVVGQLLRAFTDANRYLQAVNHQLRQRLEGTLLCPRPTPELPRAQISQNVLLNVYIADVQPWFARLERKAQIWLPAINQLLDSPLAPSAIQEYRETWINPDNPETPWRRFQELNRQHAGYWEKLLQQCGLQPGLAD